MDINYLDAFSGIGGFHKGLEEAGFAFKWIGFSEIDRFAKETYKKHFPNSEDLGDVRTIIPLNKLPGKLDLFTFGFPCQDLSVAGKRGGLHAARSGLFFEALRIIKAATPTVFIFENVKGLLSSEGGEDFTTVLRSIANLGIYDCEWQLLNTRWFLPQNRERIYFIGHLRGKSGPKVFPIGEEGQTFTGKSSLGSDSLMQVLRTQKNSQGSRVYSCDGISSTINTGGSDYYAVPVLTPARDRTRNGEAKRFKAIGEPMFTLTTQDRHGIMTGPQADRIVRHLSPVECERLQGFPEGWTEGLSDNQRYKCLGNAVSVPVVKVIGTRLLPVFE